MLLKNCLPLLIAMFILCAGCAINNQRVVQNETVENATIEKGAETEAAPPVEPPADDRFKAFRRPEGSGNPYADQLTDSQFDKRVGEILEQWNISPAAAQAFVKLETLDLNKGLRHDEMVEMFGEPRELSNGGYQYPWGFIFYFENGVAREVRFGNAPYYAYGGKIRIGSTVDEVEKFFNPVHVVTGYSANLEDRVLYKDRDGIKGLCLYNDKERGVRIGIVNNEVTELSLQRKDAFNYLTPSAETR